MSRYTGRVNLDQKLSKYAKVGINLTVSRNTLDNVPLGAGQNEYASILVSAAQFSPLLSVKDENGDYSLNQQAAYIPILFRYLRSVIRRLKNVSWPLRLLKSNQSMSSH